jgi:hypothetical protein
VGDNHTGRRPKPKVDVRPVTASVDHLFFEWLIFQSVELSKLMAYFYAKKNSSSLRDRAWK